jgi:acyl carrier protein phosphodiesterase
MNYLAHLFLSCQDEDLLIGNFIADSIKNKEVALYTPSIQQGVLLHRQIDVYTDNHPIVRQATRRLYPSHRKYAPVVIDVFFDNLLSNNWDLYTEEPLADFAKRMYATLERRATDLPEKLQQYVPRMIADNWLMRYGTEDGLQYTFDRMDTRTRFKSNFHSAVKDLKKDYELYNKEFNLFFPDVINMVNEFCSC